MGSVNISISFENIDNLLVLKFSVPRRSDLYSSIERISFAIIWIIPREPEVLLEIDTTYKVTRRLFHEYLEGEFYIAKSLLENEERYVMLKVFNVYGDEN